MNYRLGMSAMICGWLLLLGSTRAQTDWPSFGNDPGAMRYSPLNQINRKNVTQLKLAWKFDTTVANAASAARPLAEHALAPEGEPKEAAPPADRMRPRRSFHIMRLSESIPLVVDDVLYM